jgi:thioesterase domain-containing protein
MRDVLDHCRRQRLDRAALDYVPKPHLGPVLLIQPAERPDILEYRPGWEAIALGDFTTIDCPGNHRTMLDPPNVQMVADAISIAFDRMAERSRVEAAE